MASTTASKPVSAGSIPATPAKFKIHTHRAFHDKQKWRRKIALRIYGLSKLADRIDPWHGDEDCGKLQEEKA